MEEKIQKINTDGEILVPKISLDNEEDNSNVHKEGSVRKKENKMKWFVIKLSKRQKKIILCSTGVLVALFLVFGLLSYRIYGKAVGLKSSIDILSKAVQEQNLDKIKTELSNTNTSLMEFKASYMSIKWLKIMPYFGSFVSDGEHAINAATYGMEAAKILVITIEPYADIIGLSNGTQDVGSGQETTQDRLDFIIKTIPDLILKADEITQKVSLIKGEVDNIDPDRYPKKIAGKEIRKNVNKLKDIVDVSATLVENGKPLLEAAPYLMGADTKREYLVIFQNDKELRPTGGFITAYTIAKVEKGKFEPGVSDDIYNLDGKYKPKIAAPDPIINYIKGPYLLSKNLRLRDMNWSPDFKVAMDLFAKEIKSVGIKDIDGIIAVDTQVLVNILDVIGPIGVSGFGNFSTQIIPECNCPQVIYELESFADIEGPIVWSENEPGKIIYAPPNYDNRKKIIGPLMNAILSNALGQPKEKLSALFEAGFKSLLEKHVLFYVFDDEAQKAVEEFGIGGVINKYDGDYLYINDANLGGRKSNLYVKEEVSQEVEVVKDGTATKTLTITYKNPEKHDGWLNSVLPNWVRIYVPKGSELISIDGLEVKEDAYEEFDKTVFSGYFQLRPQGVAKIIVKYKLPFKAEKDYKLLIQKQPGKDSPLYSIKLGKIQEEFFLKTDKEFKFSI
ncbi:MAG: hypothetical protein US60_C0004G0033 [Microgenomates group bacterium GW2011_GWC1_37_8]|uniref:DUF4012 domain-containing protein n=1 Tax=Candidatus Woesebacteria bacterium GW2011_GWB1_38_8 TaxID=1618570 RepID=A0A0G0P8R7_9BACT|nr:MAG: hypothetical protein US60_C0004G0033 [Microgenomates group bacterium GW2011_GWC1_37_8]KKQ85701.1 MAG: hypothetical protein UT08_C0004G0013 [Candidatus Woesebacteria bacterium GW2011_GWB1_38_8]